MEGADEGESAERQKAKERERRRIWEGKGSRGVENGEEIAESKRVEKEA